MRILRYGAYKMKYAKIVNNVVIQVQPNNGIGFTEVPDDVICGMVKNGGTFSLPTKTAQEQLNDDLMAAEVFLRETDWVEPYILRNDLGLEVLPSDSNKLVINIQRNEKKLFIKNNS